MRCCDPSTSSPGCLQLRFWPSWAATLRQAWLPWSAWACLCCAHREPACSCCLPWALWRLRSRPSGSCRWRRCRWPWAWACCLGCCPSNWRPCTGAVPFRPKPHAPCAASPGSSAWPWWRASCTGFRGCRSNSRSRHRRTASRLRSSGWPRQTPSCGTGGTTATSWRPAAGCLRCSMAAAKPRGWPTLPHTRWRRTTRSWRGAGYASSPCAGSAASAPCAPPGATKPPRWPGLRRSCPRQISRLP